MKWGKDYEFLLDVSLEKGELTQSLKDKPSLDPELALTWEAFVLSSASRTYSQRTGSEGRIFTLADPIDVQAVIGVCDASEIQSADQRFRVIRSVQAMDAAYLDAVNPRVK